jgi:hypothetical protein
MPETPRAKCEASGQKALKKSENVSPQIMKYFRSTQVQVKRINGFQVHMCRLPVLLRLASQEPWNTGIKTHESTELDCFVTHKNSSSLS